MQDEFYFFMIYSGFAGGSRSGGFVDSIAFIINVLSCVDGVEMELLKSFP